MTCIGRKDTLEEKHTERTSQVTFDVFVLFIRPAAIKAKAEAAGKKASAAVKAWEAGVLLGASLLRKSTTTTVHVVGEVPTSLI